MFRYILNRIALMFLTLFLIITLTFFLMHAIPGGPFTSDKMLAPEIEAALNAKYHLNDPLMLQYWNYLKSIAMLDLGPSFKYPGVRVNDLIMEGLPVTAKVGALSLLTVVLLGVPMGVIAAVKKDKWQDVLVMSVATIGIAVPSYVIATLLLFIFALNLGWLPTFGLESWRGYILPVLALSGFYLSYVARLTRSSMLDVLDQDFMKTAKAKGLSPMKVLIRHGLRNALIPIITVLGPVVANLLTGSFIIEQIFALPGIGRHFVLSISNRDYTTIMGITIFYAFLLMLMILIVDMLYVIVDPRIKLARKKS